MNLSQIPTVTIKHPTAGRTVINERDFDPSIHELYVEAMAEEIQAGGAAEPASEPIEPTSPAPKAGESVIPDFFTTKKKK